MIIIISGKAGVGKSTTAKFIKEYLNSKQIYCDIIPLATRVKGIAELDFGWDGVKDEKGRQLLINIGTVTGRAYNPNIWVKYVCDEVFYREASGTDVFIVDDWRFPNELQYIKDHYNGKVISIRIERPEGEILKGTDNYFNESETSLPSMSDEQNPFLIRINNFYDYILYPETDLDKLKLTVSTLMETIHERK